MNSPSLPFPLSVNRRLVMPSQTCWLLKQSWLWKVWLCSSGMPYTLTSQVGCSKFRLVALHTGSCCSSVFLCKIHTSISLLALVENWNISVRETVLLCCNSVQFFWHLKNLNILVLSPSFSTVWRAWGKLAPSWQHCLMLKNTVRELWALTLTKDKRLRVLIYWEKLQH